MLAEAFCCALLMTVLGLATSYFIQHLVDSVLVRHEGRLLNALGIGMVLIVCFRTLFAVLRQYLVAHVGRKMNLTLIAGYARHLLELPLPFFEMRRVGRSSRGSTTRPRCGRPSAARRSPPSSTARWWCSCWRCSGSMMCRWRWWRRRSCRCWWLSAVAHHPAARRRSREAMEQAAQLSAHLVEDISGVETVKAFGAERVRAEEGEGRLVGLVQSIFSLQMLGISMNTLGMLVTALAGLVVLWYGGHRVMDGALTIGQLMFFYSLLGNLLEPAGTAGLGEPEAPGRAGGSRPALPGPGPGSRADRRPPQGDRSRGSATRIELQDVGFRYGCRATCSSS